LVHSFMLIANLYISNRQEIMPALHEPPSHNPIVNRRGRSGLFAEAFQFFSYAEFHGSPVMGVYNVGIGKIEDVFELVPQDHLVHDDRSSDFLSKDADLILGIGICGNPFFFIPGLFPVKVFPVGNHVGESAKLKAGSSKLKGGRGKKKAEERVIGYQLSVIGRKGNRERSKLKAERQGG